ncbi:hypothetical protein F4820DRAFT_211746 [Hypoxylon rubiginosum]|uniref:Uncharacterized protein n=1 Tax=Hypoxylon rubiginosum TaxID=110542 RepID=A0ACB9YHS0_9PEZI|nr:hypothetical protein F4820DRAFT_211746 [Hypoxylon rubiginosum]
MDSDSEGSDIFAIDNDTYESTRRNKAVLRFEHSSVVEFLQNTTNLSPHAKKFSTERSEGNAILARSSLAYILYVDSISQTPSYYPLEHWCSNRKGVGNSRLRSL